MAQLRKDKRFALVKSLGRREYKFGYEDEPEGRSRAPLRAGPRPCGTGEPPHSLP